MNIHDAMKQSTPGPLVCQKIGNNHDQHMLYDETTGKTVVLAVEGKANAAMLAHAYNHLPKLLEAIHELIDLEERMGKSCTQQVKNAYNIIAEAEEVEGI